MKLLDKVVVITGGAGLLGQEFVRAIAREGGVPVIADVDPARAESLVAAIRREPGCERVCFEALDITSKDSVTGLIARLQARHGRIDALVNSAYPRSPNYGRRFEEVEYADFCTALNRHLGGYFLVSQQFALFFQEQGAGNIVTLASIYGVVAPRFEIYEGTPMTMPVEYAAIKSALVQLNRYMMRYFKGHAIRFNCISPGGILDGQAPTFLQRYGEHAQTKGMLAPTDVTGALIFLLSDDSQFMNGQNLIVDDGFSV